MYKKKILFVIDSLNLGGAEKSLTTLLNLIDYSMYEVDLQLFSYGGDFENLVPNEVNILPILPFFEYCKHSYIKIFKKLANLNYLYSQILYSVKLREGNYNITDSSILMWLSTSNSFIVQDKEYDVAIAYAQGVPTYYVADKIKARKKIAWINGIFMPNDQNRDVIQHKYSQYNYINCVSETVSYHFSKLFPDLCCKVVIIKDIFNLEFNKKMLFLESNLDIMSSSVLNILTVGRLDKHKGYDLAIETCRILKDRDIKFKWYIIGEGNQRKMIENKIKEYKLHNSFILLGAKSNPYPYFEACDIYVQTSRFEGFGISIAEARMFNKPVVATNFDAVYSQIIPDVNGMVVDMIPEDIADGIIKMINDDKYRDKIVEFLKNEKKSNLEELDKFYELINR